MESSLPLVVTEFDLAREGWKCLREAVTRDNWCRVPVWTNVALILPWL